MTLSLVEFIDKNLARKESVHGERKAAETGKKKRWTVEEKARIVRRYLKDHVGLADLAEETGTFPGLILQWAKQSLEGLEQTFSRETYRQRKVLHRKSIVDGEI